MTTFNTNSDFSTDADSTVAHGGQATNITGYTVLRPVGSFQDLRTFTVTADGSAIGGKYVRTAEGGYGDTPQMLAMNGPGAVASATETEILFKFRVSTVANTVNFGRIRYNNATQTYYALTCSGATGSLRLVYWSGSSWWGEAGVAVAKGFTANTWWWARIRVTAAGSWSWRAWADGGSEPGTWDVTGASNTSSEAGYVGIGATVSTGMPVDYDWFSAATGTDSAPGPAGTAQEVTGTGSHSVGIGASFSGSGTTAEPEPQEVTGGGAFTVDLELALASTSQAANRKLLLTEAEECELRDENNVPVANLSGISFEWYDKTTDTDGNPAVSGTFGTNASGEARVPLFGTSLSATQEGILILEHPSDTDVRGVYRLAVH